MSDFPTELSEQQILNRAFDKSTNTLSTSSSSGSTAISSFNTGQNSDVDTVAEQITTTSVTASRGVVVKAANANSGTVYVGTSSSVTAGTADATDGFELGAGESILVEVNNANKVWVIASVNNQKVFWLAV